MLLWQKNLTPLQRRSLQRVGAALTLTVLTNFSTPGLHNPFFSITLPTDSQGHIPAYLAALLSALSVLPVLLVVWVAGRYLAEEPDEFIRALVVRALLWGFAFTMAGNAIAGVLMNLYSQPFPLTLLNADLFFASSAIAFRLLQRSYR